MKKTLLSLVFLVIPLAFANAAPSTENAKSLTDGLHIGGKTTDRIGAHGATPIVQQAATVTPWQALVNMGYIATGTDYSLQHTTVALSAANIIAMYTTPVVLVPAPGAGKSIVVQRLAFTMTRTATAFTGGAAVIVQYDSTANGAGTQALDSTLASTVITGSAGTTVSFRNGAIISDAASTVTQNKGLYVSNGTGVFATGTGTANVDVWYYTRTD